MNYGRIYDVNKWYKSMENPFAFHGVERQSSCEEHAVDCNSNSLHFFLWVW